mgnify:CR=1 FL=1
MEEFEEIYKGVEKDFDLDEERRLSVYAARWFIGKGEDEAEMLAHFEISDEDWKRWNDDK